MARQRGPVAASPCRAMGMGKTPRSQPAAILLPAAHRSPASLPPQTTTGIFVGGQRPPQGFPLDLYFSFGVNSARSMEIGDHDARR